MQCINTKSIRKKMSKETMGYPVSGQEQEEKKKKHFVLVHGAAHGAWCWFKLTPLLKAAGHSVTALDLAASGIDRRSIRDLSSMEEYTQPLLEFLDKLPSHDKVVLVGHSLGGINIALAMDKFPEKIAAGVFLAAFMPDTVHAPSYVLEQYNERTPAENWMDTEFEPYETKNGSGTLTSMSFGPKFLASRFYQLCSIEDLELAKTLVRPSSLFLEDLSKAEKFADNLFGSVPKVYVVGNSDLGIPTEFQHWMISNGGVKDVFEISEADHMSMLSAPQELCDVLEKIGLKYD